MEEVFLLPYHSLSRFPVRNMHRAVDLASEKAALSLFPTDSQLVPPSAALPSLRCKNRKIEENQEQLRAVQHIVAGSSGTAPYLVFGPPGTGKTVTVVEAIKQVSFPFFIFQENFTIFAKLSFQSGIRAVP